MRALNIAWTLTACAICASAAGDYVSTSWGTEAGLPQSTVTALLKSHDGYLWAGTSGGGVARFDGSRFAVFSQDSFPGFPSRMINSLQEDKNGAVWVGTWGEGLVRLKDGHVATYTTANGLPSNAILGLLAASNGEIWVGLRGDGLNVFDGARFTAIPGAPAVVTNIVEDRAHRIWAGGKGLVTIANNRIEKRWDQSPPFAGDLDVVFASNDGKVGVANSSGVYRFDDAKGTFAKDCPAANGQISAGAIDSSGALWVATNAGIRKCVNGNLQSIPSLPTQQTQSVIADADGALWIGTAGNGLLRLQPRRFPTYAGADGMCSDQVLSVMQDRRGVIWAGTAGGLSVLKNGRWKCLTMRDGLPANSAGTVLEDSRGDLWIGSDSGLARLSHGHIQTLGRPQGNSLQYVDAFLETRDGRVIVGGGSDHLEIFENGQFHTRMLPSSGTVRFLMEARDGAVWICASRGLVRWQDASMEVFGSRDDNFTSAYEDQDGTIWATSIHGGLARYRDGKFVQAESRAPLNYPLLAAFPAEDDDLWLTSLNGVYRVSRSQVNALFDGKSDAVSARVFGTADGFRSTECGGGMQNPVWRGADGKLWIPTAGGLTVIDPANIPAPSAPPPAIVEAIAADGQPMEARGPLRLRAGTRRVDFHYTAIDFDRPFDVRFEYKLAGFEKSWIDAGNRRAASYANLPPGNYTLEVRAAGTNGLYANPAIVQFELLPRFYQRAWVQWLGALCFIALAALAYRTRIQQVRMQTLREMEQRMRERARIARDLHDTLLQDAVQLSVTLDLASLRTADLELRETLNRAQEDVRRLIRDTRSTMGDLRPVELETRNLVEALRAHGEAIASRHNLRFQISAAEVPSPLPPALSAELFRIGQEAITNAAKHSGGTEITLEVRAARDRLRMAIRDNGKGMSFAASHETGGVRIMRERTEEAGGTFSVVSDSTGTVVTVEIPTKSAAWIPRAPLQVS